MKIANCVLIVSVVLLLSSFQQQHSAEGVWLTSVLTTLKIFNEVVKLLQKFDVIPSNDPMTNGEMYALVGEICGKLDALSEQISRSEQQIMDSIYSLKNYVSLEIEMNEVVKLKNLLGSRYQRMEIISANMDKYENQTIIDFAKWNIAQSSEAVDSMLFQIHFTYFGYHDFSRYSRTPLYQKIAEEFEYEQNNNLCPDTTAQQYIFNEMLQMFVDETRGFLINKYSFTVLRDFGLGNYYMEEEDSIREHELRSDYMVNVMQPVLEASSNMLRRCDPNTHVKGVTYDEVTRLIQGYIVNEINVNDVATCTDDCPYHVDREVYHCDSREKSGYCNRDMCHGRILRCEFDTNKDSVHICPSNDPSRRYEYFETNRGSKKNNNFYGASTSCPNSEEYVNTWLRGFYQCSYCTCYCDDPTNSDRHWNLREEVSDVANNKVVTGVRFRKVNGIFFIQIQEGTLAPLGMADPQTLQWKTLDSYELDEATSGDDYFTMDSDNRQINLDVVETDDPNFVVTGVKFVNIENSIAISIRVTEFDFGDGVLIDPESTSKWLWYDGPHNNPVALTGREANRGPNLSVRSPTRSELTLGVDHVILTHSDKIDDAAQSTVPAFDTQDVYSKLPAALGGVGLYHKGNPGYGGYILTSIHTVNYAHFLTLEEQ